MSKTFKQYQKGNFALKIFINVSYISFRDFSKILVF